MACGGSYALAHRDPFESPACRFQAELDGLTLVTSILPCQLPRAGCGEAVCAKPW